MREDFVVRCAELADAANIARVHVDTWRETYRGVMSDAILDDPEMLSRREKFWSAILIEPHTHRNTVAVAVRQGTVVGIAMSGPCEPIGEQHLYVLYVYSVFHGCGVGSALLGAVIDQNLPASLWVADPNPRAQAFYGKNGFRADGKRKIEDGVHELRMVRGPAAADPA